MVLKQKDMARKQAFTLIEIMVVLVIIGILAAITVPSYLNFIQQGASQAAQNNLLTIYGAQRNYYFNHASYCLNSGSQPTCADTLPDINTNLSLNVIDSYYTYACSTGTAPYAFCCTATNISSGSVISSLPDNLPACGGSTPSCTSNGTCSGACGGGAGVDNCGNACTNNNACVCGTCNPTSACGSTAGICSISGASCTATAGTCSGTNSCCSGNCVDTSTDNNNCGSCGNVCTSLQTCGGGGTPGICALPCDGTSTCAAMIPTGNWSETGSSCPSPDGINDYQNDSCGGCCECTPDCSASNSCGQSDGCGGVCGEGSEGGNCTQTGVVGTTQSCNGAGECACITDCSAACNAAFGGSVGGSEMCGFLPCDNYGPSEIPDPCGNPCMSSGISCCNCI